jgi:AcrR family transcriptional regulator
MNATPLRERQKLKRRGAILAAARSLFSRFDGDSISAEQIAAVADVSAPTLYNLIGTRNQLLATLLDEMLGEVEDELRRLSISDPLERGAAVIDICAQRFILEAPVLRYVVRKLIGLERASEVRMTHDAIFIQRLVLLDAVRAGQIDSRWDAYQIAVQIYFDFVGALLLWAGQMLEDKHFRTQVQHGYWAILASFATVDGRTLIEARLADVQAQLIADHPILAVGGPANSEHG